MPDEALLLRARKLIEPGERCIDVGAGTNPQALARYQHHVCIEPNPLSVHWLERRCYCVKRGRAEDILPDMAPAFAVYLLDVLHLLDPENSRNVLALAKRKAIFQLVVSLPPPLKFGDQPRNMWAQQRTLWSVEMLGSEPWQVFMNGEAFIAVLSHTLVRVPPPPLIGR